MLTTIIKTKHPIILHTISKMILSFVKLVVTFSKWMWLCVCVHSFNYCTIFVIFCFSLDIIYITYKFHYTMKHQQFCFISWKISQIYQRNTSTYTQLVFVNGLLFNMFQGKQIHSLTRTNERWYAKSNIFNALEDEECHPSPFTLSLQIGMGSIHSSVLMHLTYCSQWTSKWIST